MKMTAGRQCQNIISHSNFFFETGKSFLSIVYTVSGFSSIFLAEEGDKQKLSTSRGNVGGCMHELFAKKSFLTISNKVNLEKAFSCEEMHERLWLHDVVHFYLRV